MAGRRSSRCCCRYAIDDLKKALSEAVYNDPDVLTQFHGADDLTARIGKATSFDDLVAVLRYAATEEQVMPASIPMSVLVFLAVLGLILGARFGGWGRGMWPRDDRL